MDFFIAKNALWVFQAILIALYFHEHPKTQAYIGFVLIMLGVVLAQKSSTQRMEFWLRTKRMEGG